MNKTLSPVALFAYNRLGHLSKTVSSLKKCKESSLSDLYIFCDGPKSSADMSLCREVQKFCESISGFKSINVIISEVNKGLADSIINGVNYCLSKNESIIVLEDDLLVSPYFLKFMNDGIHKFKSNQNVASIHGYLYPISSEIEAPFFLRGADCWGWATWKSSWLNFNPDGKQLLNELEFRKLTGNFDLDDTFGYTKMLKSQISGKNNSWAIRWHASCFLLNKLTLYPNKSLVMNIGNDNSGTHSYSTNVYDTQLSTHEIPIPDIIVEESILGRNLVKQFFANSKSMRRRLLNKFNNIIFYLHRFTAL